MLTTCIAVSGLLHFLRVYDVGSNNLSFQKLLKPELADVFSNLVSRIGIRTVKAQIEGELSLPSQERFIVPVNFTPIELYNYRARYGDALTELNFHMDASRLTSTWSIDRFLMVRLLSTWLRQQADYQIILVSMAAYPPSSLFLCASCRTESR